MDVHLARPLDAATRSALEHEVSGTAASYSCPRSSWQRHGPGAAAARESAERSPIRALVDGRGYPKEGMSGRADWKLIKAISEGDVVGARTALDAGAELNRRWPGRHPVTIRANGLWRGERPMTVAASHGNAPVVRLLIQRGANVDLMNATWHTPLMLASAGGRSAIARLLLDAGADVNRMNRNQETALTYAVVWGQLRTVKLLLAYGADVEERRGGWSPLMYAANSEHPRIVEVLFEYGADPARRDRYGRTARDIAAQNPSGKIARAFEKIAAARAGSKLTSPRPVSRPSNPRVAPKTKGRRLPG